MDAPLHTEPHIRFRALWKRYETLVRWRCLLAAHGNVERACDYVQEVALRLIQFCDGLTESASPQTERAWVIRVIRSAIDNARRTLDTHTASLDAQSLADSLADDDTAARLRETLDDLMPALTDEEQQFIRFHLEGYNTDELATLYGLSYTAAATRLTRLRQKLARRARELHYIK